MQSEKKNHIAMKRIIRLAVVLVAMALTGCGIGTPRGGYADMVVYGKIFTSDADTMAQAFAVKDGKYIFVGNEDDVQEYINDKTQIIDHRGKGMVMAGCTEGHGHYFMSNFYTCGTYVIKFDTNDDKDAILRKVEAMAKKNPTYVYGFGFNYAHLSEGDRYPKREELDKILSDVPVYLADNEGHKGIANTFCIQKSGILDKDGKVKSDFKYKEGVVTDADGYPTGMLREQAGTYVRVRGCTPDDKPAVWEKAINGAQQQLNSMGYTAAFEGWANKFGMTTYQVVKNLDETNRLTLNLGLAYEIENLTPADVAAALDSALKTNETYSHGHVHANYVKLFMDGTPETGTGYMILPSANGTNGKPIWQPDELEKVTLDANGKGLTMHIHAMGDRAVKNVVDAYEKAYNAKYRQRNQIVHLRNVDEADYKRMADCGIVASCGVLWHAMSDEDYKLYTTTPFMNAKYNEEGYPYQAFADHGVHTSISTDAPATTGAPTDPFGIMEVAFTGTQTFGEIYCPTPWDTAGLAKDRAQFLRALTIEGAYQMSTEESRGSIAVGKYADFILIDQDVLECPLEKLHDTQVLNTYFEGKCVFEMGN